MGNRIMRTVLFAASALLSMSAFGAGAARFGTLRNSDWVVTNAWQAVSNRTHDLILEIGQGDSLPPDWLNVSNAAMNAVQSIQPAYDYTDNALISFSSTGSVFRSLSYGTPTRWTDATGCVWEAGYRYDDDWVADSSRISQVSWTFAGYDDDPDLWAIYFTVDGSFQAEAYSFPPGPTQTNLFISASDWETQYEGAFDFNIYRSPHESTNLVGRVALTNDIVEAISTNNEAFVSAVLAAPLVGADPSDLSELAEYGSYGTVGAALLALIAGLAALKRRMGTAETTISGKLDGAAAYPEWDSSEAYDYGAGDIVSFGGRIYRLDETDYRTGQVPPENLNAWTQVYLKDLKQDALSPTQLAAVNSGVTAAKVATWDGYSAQIAQKANATDLPYALVTRTPENGGATLLDRAVNAVPVSAATTLTLPALDHAGKARDFLVRLSISGSTVPTITFSPDGNESVTYETDGDEFPVPDEVGTWLYSFTETAASVFAVALKSVSVVTQGGA